MEVNIKITEIVGNIEQLEGRHNRQDLKYNKKQFFLKNRPNFLNSLKTWNSSPKVTIKLIKKKWIKNKLIEQRK